MNKILPWLFLVLGIIFAAIIWDFISLPYDNSNTIIGEYSNKKINPLNDTLRGLFFIFFPLLLYFIFYFKFKVSIQNFKQFHAKDSILNNNISNLSYLLILFSILEFYSLNYKDFISTLDTHHEGTFLTAQLNFFSKNKFWTGTFFDYGFLGNSIGIFPNYIFGKYTIGIQRFSFIFLILLNKILIILLCKKIVESLNSSNKKELIFLILSLSSITLASFYENITPFHPRIFIFLIFCLLVFKVILKNKVNVLTLIITGLFSGLSLIFYWDIGTYINVMLMILIIYLLLLKRFNDFNKLISGIILSWLLFYIIVPKNEIIEFFNQYYFIINISDYLIGLEFPKPFTDGSTRHTKALLLIIISGIFVINYIFSNSNKESINSKFLVLFLFISAVVFFKSGLTRSDGPHIKYTSGIYTLIIFFFISYYSIDFLSNKKIFNKFFKFFEQPKYLYGFSLVIFSLFFFQNNFSNLLNITNFNKNFYRLTKIDDSEFLTSDYKNFLNIYKDLIINEKCVQQFTDDNAIPYLVNKPTCTKFYVNAHIIKNWTENEFIEELKNSSPNYIVYSSEINWFKNRNNAPIADKFITKNYFLYENLSPWTIYKKR